MLQQISYIAFYTYRFWRDFLKEASVPTPASLKALFVSLKKQTEILFRLIYRESENTVPAEKIRWKRRIIREANMANEKEHRTFIIINIFLIIKKIKGRFFNYKKDPNQSTATKTSGFKSHRANSPNAAEKS